MAKISKKVMKDAINKAIVGYRIPMMSIPALSKKLEAEFAAGGSMESMKAIVAAFPGVEAA